MSVKEMFSNWKQVRRNLIDAIRCIPEEKLEWRPMKGMNSFGDIVRHIAETEDFWIGKVIFGKRWKSRTKKSHPTLEIIIKDLEKVHLKTLKLLNELKVEMLNDKKRIGRDGKVSVFWILWHVIEHEIHHRAQIFTYLRLLDLKPPKI